MTMSIRDWLEVVYLVLFWVGFFLTKKSRHLINNEDWISRHLGDQDYQEAICQKWTGYLFIVISIIGLLFTFALMTHVI